MKVNLIRNEADVLNGYENISYKTIFDLSLHDLVDNAEATEFRAIDILPFFPANQSEQLLDVWIKKLAHSGKIIIGFLEIVEIAKGIANHTMNIDEINICLYGPNEEEGIKKTCFTVQQIVDYLQSKGLKITRKRIEDYKCIVEAERL